MRAAGKLGSILATLVIAGCLTEPSNPFAGTWVGTAEDNIGGTGTFQATMSHTDNAVTGTWRIDFSDPDLSSSGSLTGLATVTTIQATLTPSSSDACPLNLTGSRSGDEITGTYASFGCLVAISGTFSGTRSD